MQGCTSYYPKYEGDPILHNHEVKQFEKSFADYLGSSHCISLANGTDAIELGLKALGVERGDRVRVAWSGDAATSFPAA